MEHWGAQMKRLNLNNFRPEILESSKPCLVLFKNTGCGLCDALLPVLFRIKAKYGMKVKLGYVETSDQEDLAELFEITGVPTLFFFRHGDATEVEYPSRPDMNSGYSEEYIIDYLDAHLNE